MDCAKTPTDHTKDRANSAGRLMADRFLDNGVLEPEL